MTTTIRQMREALATTLGTSISGVQVSPWLLSAFTPPSLQIKSGVLNYDSSFGAVAEKTYTFQILGMIGLATDIGAQILLSELSDAESDKSVWGAVAKDETLGGVVLNAQVVQASEEHYYRPAAERPEIIGREWTVDILAAGS